MNTLVITLVAKKESRKIRSQHSALKRALIKLLTEENLQDVVEVNNRQKALQLMAEKAGIDAVVDLLCRQGLAMSDSLVDHYAGLFGRSVATRSTDAATPAPLSELTCPLQ